MSAPTRIKPRPRPALLSETARFGRLLGAVEMYLAAPSTESRERLRELVREEGAAAGPRLVVKAGGRS